MSVHDNDNMKTRPGEQVDGEVVMPSDSHAKPVGGKGESQKGGGKDGDVGQAKQSDIGRTPAKEAPPA